jgi:hemerythrin
MRIPPELVTEDQEIDFAHANLLAELKRMRSIGPDEVRASIDFLRQHTAQHFAREERHMKEVGYPGREAHRQEHLIFFDQFVLLKARIEQDGATPENVGALVDAVERWVAGHVLRQDRRFAQFVRATRSPR